MTSYIGIHDYGDDYATYLFRDDDARRPHLCLHYRRLNGAGVWGAHRYDWTEDEIDASIRELEPDDIRALMLLLPINDLPAALVGTDRVCVPA